MTATRYVYHVRGTARQLEDAGTLTAERLCHAVATDGTLAGMTVARELRPTRSAAVEQRDRLAATAVMSLGEEARLRLRALLAQVL